jgi:hypothetical protein
VYNCIEIPYEIAFSDISKSEGRAAVGILIDLFFVLDLVLNFFTAYENKKTKL